jgi:hydroxypyruvate isomerase
MASESLPRRDFLAATALGTVALSRTASAQAPAAQPPVRKAKITSSVMLWTLKGTFEEKLEIAAKAGLQSVELVSEHIKWTDAQVRDMKKLAESFRLGMDTIIGQPDWKMRPVSMVDPAQRDNFLKDIETAITWAQKLEIPQIILMSGDAIPGKTDAEQFASLVEGTKRAGELAAKAKVTLIVEPLNNRVNHKGFFLTNNRDGLRLMKEVDNPYMKLLFDIYHEQVQVGDVVRTLTEAAPHVAVFHVADNPGRNDPGTGEINYANVYKAIQKTGFAGYITMEYLPLGEPVASLKKAVDAMRAGVAAS